VPPEIPRGIVNQGYVPLEGAKVMPMVPLTANPIVLLVGR